MVRKVLPIALLIALLATIGSPTLSAREKVKWFRPETGTTVPDFAFIDFAGHEHHLSGFVGHYVLLDFWATWCGPCIKETSVLKKAYSLYQKRGLRILGMDSDKRIASAEKFVRKNQIPWLQSTPQSTQKIVESELRVRWYPTIILLDPQRKIILVSGDGHSVLKGKKLLKKLDQLLPSASEP